MTCCPKWRRPSKTSRRRSARVHSEGLPVMLGRSWWPARNSSQRGLPINNKMHALSAARNFRLRAEIRNGEMVTQTRRSPDNSAPRRLPPGSSRLQANKHPAGAGSPEARCFGRGSSEKRTDNRRPHSVAAGSLASRKFLRRGTFRGRRRRQHPGSTLAFVETEDSANFRVDIQFAKVRRLFRPLHGPAYAADKLGFMGAIPC